MSERFTCKVCGSHELIVCENYQVYVDDADGTVEIWQKCGPLDEDHHWEYEEEEELLETVSGNAVYDKVEFYVYCAGCEREVEFGWSHPDYGGRIWPVECTDFAAGKAWMDPKYR